tara:strand:- start:623 stop:793 length:171 start_codon:yes stop_codon:yes gene_type:complete
MFNMPATIETLDKSTHIALNAIWKELVKECIANHVETGITENRDSVEQTPFTKNTM